MSVTTGASAQPLVTPVDLTTVNVLGGEESRQAVLADNQEIQSLTAAFSAQLTAIQALPAGPERDASLSNAAGGLAGLLTASSRARLAQIAAGMDQSTDQIAESALVRAYYASPRVEVLRASSSLDGKGAASILFSVDLLKDDIRAIAFPGQVPSVTVGFQMMRGISDTIVEAMALNPTSPQGPLVGAEGVVTIFQASQSQGIAVQLITPADQSQVQFLGVSAEPRLS